MYVNICNNVRLNHFKTDCKEVIKELEGLRYVDSPNLNQYDYVTIEDNGQYIELIMEERYKRDSLGKYKKVSNGCVTGYKKNNVSGFYQMVEFI